MNLFLIALTAVVCIFAFIVSTLSIIKDKKLLRQLSGFTFAEPEIAVYDNGNLFDEKSEVVEEDFDLEGWDLSEKVLFLEENRKALKSIISILEKELEELTCANIDLRFENTELKSIIKQRENQSDA